VDIQGDTNFSDSYRAGITSVITKVQLVGQRNVTELVDCETL